MPHRTVAVVAACEVAGGCAPSAIGVLTGVLGKAYAAAREADDRAEVVVVLERPAVRACPLRGRGRLAPPPGRRTLPGLADHGPAMRRALRQFGETGMTGRSSRPHFSPPRFPARAERRITEVHVPRRRVPARIAGPLRLTPDTMHRVPTRCGLARLTHLDRATGQAIRRYERPADGSDVGPARSPVSRTASASTIFVAPVTASRPVPARPSRTGRSARASPPGRLR